MAPRRLSALAFRPHTSWATRVVVSGGGVALVAESRPRADLAHILDSHPALHSAEGEVYRNALALAARSHGLKTLEVPPKRLRSDAARAGARRRLSGGAAADDWQGDRLAAAEDHKDATLAGLIALAGRS
jgi:hypothetical protein